MTTAALDSLPQRSLIPACDVDISRLGEILEATGDNPAVGAYKIGASLALENSLRVIAETARAVTSKPLIYDHQKAGTDIPDTAHAFVNVLAEAGMDAIILFPFAGPMTERVWIQAAMDAGLDVIVGGYMTHPNFIEDESGFLSLTSIDRIYRLAASSGVRHFVVPGNNPGAIEAIRESIRAEIAEPTLYAPGFVAQGGELSNAAQAAGDRWHAIIGRAIYEAPDISAAVESLARNLS